MVGCRLDYAVIKKCEIWYGVHANLIAFDNMLTIDTFLANFIIL